MKEEISLMVIDDDADDRALFIQAVKEIDEHIECMWAKDGLHALQTLRDEAVPLPHCIFLDIRMPRINGKKFLIEVKADASLKNIPVIIYTTSRELEDSNELKELGAVHFISKPTNPEDIYYVVSCVIEDHLLWRSQQQ